MFVYIVSYVIGEHDDELAVAKTLYEKFYSLQFQEGSWILLHPGSADEVLALLPLVGFSDSAFVVRLTKRSDIAPFEPVVGIDRFLDFLTAL